MYNRKLFLLLVTLILSASVMAQDPGEVDSLFVGYAEVDAGQKAVIEVNFSNDSELAALTIPLRWHSSDITLDSVSYVGSRIDYVGTKPITIYAPEQTVVFGAIIFFEANIPAGSGLLATLHFDIPPGTADQMIAVDSTTKESASVLFTNPNSSSFVPFVESGYIQVGEPQIPAHIDFSVTSMDFDGTVGFPSPPSQQLMISNTGDGTFDWVATTTSGWLSSVPDFGTAGLSFVGINANTSGLAEGVYYDTVIVTSAEADNSPQILPVTLTMTKLPPVIVADPTSFSVSGVQGGANPSDRILNISTSVAGSDLNWSVTNNEGWLSLSPASGMPPDPVTLSFDITGLSFGYYYDTVVVSDPNAINSPVLVPITLQIVSDLPVMEIDPPELTIVGQIGVNPAPRSVYISNSGEGTLTYEVMESSELISNVVPLSGTAPSNIFFTFETDTLDFGTYYDTVTITSPEAINSPQQVVIKYLILSNPANLYIIPASIAMNYYECWQGVGASPVVKNFQIQNLGGGSMTWEASVKSDWLSLFQESGVGDLVNSVGLTEVVDDLPVGTYVDTVTVSSNIAMNSPKKIEVVLNIIEGTETPELQFNQAVINIPAQEVFGVLLGELASVGEVVNVEAGCMDYWVEEDVPWLTIIDSVGEAPIVLRAALDVGSYTFGTYPDSIFIHSSSATNSPIRVDVSMLVWRMHGDHDWNNFIHVGDAVQMIHHIFRHGPAAMPEPYVADTNCDFFVDVSDVVVLINYIFRYGNKPCGNL